MIDFTIVQLNDIAKNIEFNKDDSYLKTYPYFISYFKNLDKITTENIVIGISLVYSWMPTILKKLDLTNINLLASILNKAKSDELIKEEEFESLKNAFNNSVVGSSKLLHFINPEKYAIWDSKVYQSLHGKTPYHDTLNKTVRYYEYIKWIESVRDEDSFKYFFETMKQILGNGITENRAIEYALFKKED